MTRQMVMMEVDVPPGYEATGEYRAANVGEIYMGAHEPVVFQTNAMGVWPRIILRPKWQPPACFPEGTWLYQCFGDYWYLSNIEPPPHLFNSTWHIRRDDALPAPDFAAFHGEKFTPPEGVTTIQVLRGTP